MAKVSVCIQSFKTVEVDIDDSYIALDLDRSASTDQNDTVYRSEFVNGNALAPIKKLRHKLNLDSNSEIISIIDTRTDSLLYEG